MSKKRLDKFIIDTNRGLAIVKGAKEPNNSKS